MKKNALTRTRGKETGTNLLTYISGWGQAAARSGFGAGKHSQVLLGRMDYCATLRQMQVDNKSLCTAREHYRSQGSLSPFPWNRPTWSLPGAMERTQALGLTWCYHSFGPCNWAAYLFILSNPKFPHL